MSTHIEQQWRTYDNSLEDLGGNRGENPLIIVSPNVGIDVRQWLLPGAKQYTKCDVNILQVWNINHKIEIPFSTNLEEN